MKSLLEWMNRKIVGDFSATAIANEDEQTKTELVNISLVEPLSESSMLIAQEDGVSMPDVETSLKHEEAIGMEIKSVETSVANFTTTVVSTLFEPGPNVKVIVRGSRHYATCPHCEGMWSLTERVATQERRRRSLEELSCPSCDKFVTIPPETNISRLN